MGAGYGFAGHIGFAKESSGGTPVAATNYIEAMSENLTSTPDRFETKNVVGRYSEPDDMAGVRRVGGDIVFPGQPVDIGHFLLAGMGIQSGSVVLSGFLWQNDFIMRTSDYDAAYMLQPYTFEIFRDVTSSQQYAGCNVNQLQFAIAPNQDLRVSASIIGRSELQLAKTTPTYTGSPSDPFAFDTASIQIGGAASELFEALTIQINNQGQGIPGLNNSTSIRGIRRTGPQIIRVSGSLAFEIITEMQNFRNQTEQRLVVSMTRANSFAIVFDVPRLVYTAHPVGMGGRDRQVISFSGVGRYHSGSASAIKIGLTTTKSAY